MSRNNKKNKKRNYNQPNFWGMIQNVLIASLNKGQFLLGIIAIVVIILAIKVETKDVGTLLKLIVNKFDDLSFLGWVLGVFSTSGWFLNVTSLRRLHSIEMSRVSNEKRKLQENLMRKKLKSSN